MGSGGLHRPPVAKLRSQKAPSQGRRGPHLSIGSPGLGIKSWFVSRAPQGLEHFPVLPSGSPKPFAVSSSLCPVSQTLRKLGSALGSNAHGDQRHATSPGVPSLHMASLEPLSQLGSSCDSPHLLCFLFFSSPLHRQDSYCLNGRLLGWSPNILTFFSPHFYPFFGLHAGGCSPRCLPSPLLHFPFCDHVQSQMCAV